MDLGMMPAQPKSKSARYWLRRLNVLLRFARLDPWKLNDDALKTLLDEIYLTLAGDPDSQDLESFSRWEFDAIATREALSEAQRKLGGALPHLLAPGELPLRSVQFKLIAEELTICSIANNYFWTILKSKHLPSLVYTTFAEVLHASGVKVSDFIHCSHCKNLFVPLREPREGTPTYCSPECASVIASRNYRARKAAARLKKKKGKKKRSREGRRNPVA